MKDGPRQEPFTTVLAEVLVSKFGGILVFETRFARDSQKQAKAAVS